MYSNDFIYDWNIDGLSEHKIFNVLRQMTMASTAYLTDGDDHNAVHLILAGFSRTLKYWWENCLNDKERFYVQTSVNEEGEQYAVLRLMYAITKHFIGDPRVFEEKNSEILQNLRCRTLSDFKWYHDVLLAKVMTRGDARAPYWKEKFLYELSRALTENVQETLREKYNGTISYGDLTYGDLIGEVKREGLKLCSQLRLQHQVKRDLKASKKDLGSFCAQYELKCQYHHHKNIKNKNIIKKNLIKNTKNINLIKLMIKNKYLIKNINEKLDVLSVVKRVI